ncbi:MAG: hypothetical protein NTY47_02710, partial [Candidatus Omnitrophica bacterium]|nr:hypothetical protein [Candidatus Omnitrophota bacterium]
MPFKKVLMNALLCMVSVILVSLIATHYLYLFLPKDLLRPEYSPYVFGAFALFIILLGLLSYKLIPKELFDYLAEKMARATHESPLAQALDYESKLPVINGQTASILRYLGSLKNFHFFILGQELFIYWIPGRAGSLLSVTDEFRQDAKQIQEFVVSVSQGIPEMLSVRLQLPTGVRLEDQTKFRLGGFSLSVETISIPAQVRYITRFHRRETKSPRLGSFYQITVPFLQEGREDFERICLVYLNDPAATISDLHSLLPICGWSEARRVHLLDNLAPAAEAIRRAQARFAEIKDDYLELIVVYERAISPEENLSRHERYYGQKLSVKNIDIDLYRNIRGIACDSYLRIFLDRPLRPDCPYKPDALPGLIENSYLYYLVVSRLKQIPAARHALRAEELRQEFICEKDPARQARIRAALLTLGERIPEVPGRGIKSAAMVIPFSCVFSFQDITGYLYHHPFWFVVMAALLILWAHSPPKTSGLLSESPGDLCAQLISPFKKSLRSSQDYTAEVNGKTVNVLDMAAQGKEITDAMLNALELKYLGQINLAHSAVFKDALSALGRHYHRDGAALVSDNTLHEIISDPVVMLGQERAQRFFPDKADLNEYSSAKRIRIGLRDLSALARAITQELKLRKGPNGAFTIIEAIAEFPHLSRTILYQLLEEDELVICGRAVLTTPGKAKKSELIHPSQRAKLRTIQYDPKRRKFVDTANPQEDDDPALLQLKPYDIVVVGQKVNALMLAARGQLTLEARSVLKKDALEIVSANFACKLVRQECLPEPEYSLGEKQFKRICANPGQHFADDPIALAYFGSRRSLLIRTRKGQPLAMKVADVDMVAKFVIAQKNLAAKSKTRQEVIQDINISRHSFESCLRNDLIQPSYIYCSQEKSYDAYTSAQEVFIRETARVREHQELLLSDGDVLIALASMNRYVSAHKRDGMKLLKAQFMDLGMGQAYQQEIYSALAQIPKKGQVTELTRQVLSVLNAVAQDGQVQLCVDLNLEQRPDKCVESVIDRAVTYYLDLCGDGWLDEFRGVGISFNRSEYGSGREVLDDAANSLIHNGGAVFMPALTKEYAQAQGCSLDLAKDYCYEPFVKLLGTVTRNRSQVVRIRVDYNGTANYAIVYTNASMARGNGWQYQTARNPKKRVKPVMIEDIRSIKDLKWWKEPADKNILATASRAILAGKAVLSADLIAAYQESKASEKVNAVGTVHTYLQRILGMTKAGKDDVVRVPVRHNRNIRFSYLYLLRS